ncbi:hypothetical protein N7466_006431 [Penicillium verhagenii]|uniref:uncharacterized protein n=1 Tax=Penicillium verhagenii TaxID=1562060 RepID=UPI00254567EA|nr:uncharacterized protein N7466_006431 [Penicillium verhagenii]KAJ5930938.1 hypothetical protein N7466_006431 [Penicillium verhagenii]
MCKHLMGDDEIGFGLPFPSEVKCFEWDGNFPDRGTVWFNLKPLVGFDFTILIFRPRLKRQSTGRGDIEGYNGSRFASQPKLDILP